MNLTRGSAAVVLFLAVGISGCGSTGPGSPGAGSPSNSARPTSTGSPGAASNVRVTVHDAGAEPRQRLRFSVSAGQRQHATLSMKMGISMSVNGHQAPMTSIPEMRVGMDTSVSDVSSGGDITSSFQYGDLQVSGSGTAVDELRAKLGVISKIKGTLRFAANGGLMDAQIEFPDGVDPTIRSLLSSLREQLANLSVPLPDEPVGIGATWTARTELTLNGLRAAVDYDYRLVERDGNRLVLGMSAAEQIMEQRLQLPTMPPGVTAQVHASRVVGSGHIDLDLGHLIPVDSSADMSGTIRMAFEHSGKHFEMAERLHMTVSLGG